MSSGKPSIKEVMQAADDAARSGNANAAIGMYRQILAHMPKHSKAKKALSKLEKSVGGSTSQMTQDDANLLVQLLSSGQFEQVENFAMQMADVFRSEPFVFNILGLAQSNLGKSKDAVRSFKWAIKLNPNFAEAYSNLGSHLVKFGSLTEAEVVLRKCISKNPNYADAHHNLGIALVSQKRLDDARSHYDRAIALKPNYSNALNSRGTLKNSTGDMSGAIEDFEAALKISPNDADFNSNLGGSLSALGRNKDALFFLERSLKANPENLDNLRRYAIILNESGRPEEAMEFFEKILQRQGDSAEDLKLKMSISKNEDRPELAKDIANVLARTDLDDEQIVHLNFAMGFFYEQQREYQKSYQHLAIANDTYRSILPPLPEPDDKKFAKIRRIKDTNTFSHLEPFGNQTTQPIFIFGMMRSGTSLVEQILSSHPLVFGAGELTAATQLGSELYELGAAATQKDLDRFVEGYLAELLANAGDAKYVTDKMPGNFFNIGLLKTAFPKAKFVNLVRDPRDNCFSIYKNYFATYAHQYAYNQEELAAFANEYKHLMNEWDEVYPDEIYHVKYEALVADQKGQSRALLDYVGLPWDDAVLDFHKTERSVRTASVNQVRKKIYKSSVKSWQNYAENLAPLFDGLDAELWADAYSD